MQPNVIIIIVLILVLIGLSVLIYLHRKGNVFGTVLSDLNVSQDLDKTKDGLVFGYDVDPNDVEIHTALNKDDRDLGVPYSQIINPNSAINTTQHDSIKPIDRTTILHTPYVE